MTLCYNVCHHIGIGCAHVMQLTGTQLVTGGMYILQHAPPLPPRR